MQGISFLVRASRTYTDTSTYYYNPLGEMGLFLILSVVAAVAIYFVFLNPKNENKFVGFVKWLYNFLSFRILFLEAVLKILYITSVITTVCSSVYIMFQGEIGLALTVFLSGLVGGRLIFEAFLLGIMLVKNTSDIRKKMIDPDGFNNEKKSDEYDAFENIKDKVIQKTVQSAQGKVCENCGTNNTADSGFCSNCGSPLK